MLDPPHFSMFKLRFRTGDKPVLGLDYEFVRRHTKVLLSSDTSERVWKVKLDGDKLADGWEEFAGFSKFKNGDVLVFRHDGDETFHVSVSSRSNSSDDKWSEDDVGNILVKKDKRQEVGSSSGHSSILKAHVTPYNLDTDRLDLAKKFTNVVFGEQYKPHEIDLVNKKGRRWTLALARNISTGAFYMRRGWSNFCTGNGLRLGDSCEFELIENGERPTLLLCSQESYNDHEEKCPEVVVVKNLLAFLETSCVYNFLMMNQGRVFWGSTISLTRDGFKVKPKGAEKGANNNQLHLESFKSSRVKQFHKKCQNLHLLKIRFLSHFNRLKSL